MTTQTLPEATHALQVAGPPAYPVYLENGIALRCGHLFAAHGIQRAVLISNPVVGALHGAAVRSAIREAGVQVDCLEVPDGEAFKTLSVVSRLYSDLAALQADRSTALVALGGGVVGDLVGFVAATYGRGVPLVHIPTSLVSMVDSSIGGKVGVDLPQGKNLVGAFYSPRFVVCDPLLLSSLPPRQLSNGFAEIIKLACLASPELLAALASREPALGCQDLDVIVARAAELKIRIVSEDPFERGPRVALNFGHTLGHALEAARGFQQLLHGEAVALGLLAAVRVSRAMGVLEEDYEEQLLELLKRFRLPVTTSDVGWSRVAAALCLDKKRVEGQLRFVLPVRLGQVVVRDDVSIEVIREAYESLIAHEVALESDEEGLERGDEDAPSVVLEASALALDDSAPEVEPSYEQADELADEQPDAGQPDGFDDEADDAGHPSDLEPALD